MISQRNITKTKNNIHDDDVQQTQNNNINITNSKQTDNNNRNNYSNNVPKDKQNKKYIQQKRNNHYIHKQQQQTVTMVCSKYNHCYQDNQLDRHHQNNITNNKFQHNQSDDSYFSCSSDLLTEQKPKYFNEVVPEVHFQVKPYIDNLVSTNIMLNKYQQLYERVEKEEKERHIQENIQKVRQQAKQALLKSKSRAKDQQQVHQQPKWGHQVFTEIKEHTAAADNGNNTNNNKKDNNPTTDNNKHRQKSIELKPVYERIKQYKQKQQITEENNEKQTQKSHLAHNKKLNEDELKNTQQRIVDNAISILKEKDNQAKLLKQKQLKIRQKVKNIQQQSLNNVAKSKKKPLTLGDDQYEDFDLGDSQYSTFDARQEGRRYVKKLEKKRKKKTAVLDSQKQKRNSLKEKISKIEYPVLKNNAKKKEKQKRLSASSNLQHQQNVQNSQQRQANHTALSSNQALQSQSQYNGKFYVWNIPIQKQDYETIALNKAQQIIRQKKKAQEKSFRQQANEIIQKKLKARMEKQFKKSKQQEFLELIETRKHQINQQFVSRYQPLQYTVK